MVQNPFHTDQQLLEALAAGDREVTTQLYKTNYPIVKGWIIKNGGAEADAADIFQEALAVLFGKGQDTDFRLTCTISTYLFAISKRIWYKKLEKQGRNPVFLVNDTAALENTDTNFDEGIRAHHERETYFGQLERAMEQLGEPCRSLLMAYYHEDRSMQEISVGFGYTNAENAKNQKYKCLNRLKKLFFSLQAE
jgi:RNA polymerase sigma factor (sigma-70 family)